MLMEGELRNAPTVSHESNDSSNKKCRSEPSDLNATFILIRVVLDSWLILKTELHIRG